MERKIILLLFPFLLLSCSPSIRNRTDLCANIECYEEVIFFSHYYYVLELL